MPDFHVPLSLTKGAAVVHTPLLFIHVRVLPFKLDATPAYVPLCELPDPKSPPVIDQAHEIGVAAPLD